MVYYLRYLKDTEPPGTAICKDKDSLQREIGKWQKKYNIKIKHYRKPERSLNGAAMGPGEIEVLLTRINEEEKKKTFKKCDICGKTVVPGDAIWNEVAWTTKKHMKTMITTCTNKKDMCQDCYDEFYRAIFEKEVDLICKNDDRSF